MPFEFPFHSSLSSVSHIQLSGTVAFPWKSGHAQNREGFSAHMSLKAENNKNVKLLKKAKSIYQYISCSKRLMTLNDPELRHKNSMHWGVSSYYKPI